MDLAVDDPDEPFDEGTQVQPCSIDLRISNIFWKPSRRRRLWRRLSRLRENAIDLRHARLQDLDPLRDWRRIELRKGHAITVKPGEAVMGRVYERFRLPADHAGKLEGRSSFARLGLAIHCTADFINPGWSGYMPLQLVNLGPYPIRLTPYLPICQLMLIPLSSLPERSYGDPELQSKYLNDDGGPSLWWRDSRVRALQTRLGEVHIGEQMTQQIVEVARLQNPDVLERLQQHVGRQRVAALEHADGVLESFARSEDRRRLWDRLAIAVLAAAVATLLGSVFAAPGVWHAVVAAAVAISAPAALCAYVRQDSGYLGRRELQEARLRPMPPRS